eukprot:scaffold11.g3989.t1
MVALEETPEGLAMAAKTREELKSKKRQLEAHVAATPAPKRATRPPPTCSHDVAVPEGYKPEEQLDPELHGGIENPVWRGPMLKEYPFVLDPFQKTAIACIERGENVLVSAHTSAGKTVVAEYAIAKALKNNQVVVYTSPIKALSNQKYRELNDEFGEVGLMTGDVTINPNAPVIVMTTEILRSMIYRGSELMREIAWVIFDEVHYMQDRERGVVWEETIIFMPKGARMVFLSATLPNAREFAEWVAYLHNQPCHVVYTDYRPTPLMHYAFPPGGRGMYLIVDERGNFREDNFSKLRLSMGVNDAADGGEGSEAATQQPQQQQADGGRGGGGRGGRRGKWRAAQLCVCGSWGENSRGAKKGAGPGGNKKEGSSTSEDLIKIVKLIKERAFYPAIVFSFSRRECEAYSTQMLNEAHNLDFNSPEEKEAVESIYCAAIELLSEEDRELPFVTSMLPMLRRGIGVHHSGILPILKELVEVLFQDGLVKCLFSTETFAMGLNMPARTVVFTALRKWDGRRGKDTSGIVMMMVDGELDAGTCRSMVQGKASPLLSSFRLSYYTLLNLLRRLEGTSADMEYVIAHSFSQFQHERQLPQLNTGRSCRVSGPHTAQLTARLKAIQEESSAIGVATDAAAEEFAVLKAQLAEAEATVRAFKQRPDYSVHFLRPGRLVRVQQGGVDWGWGVVVCLFKQTDRLPPAGSAGANGAGAYVVDVLLCCAEGGRRDERQPQPAALDDEDAQMQVIPLSLKLVSEISALRINIPDDLRSAESRRAVLLTLRSLVKRRALYSKLGYAGRRLPELDPEADMGIQERELVEAVVCVATLRQQLEQNPFHKAELAGPGSEELQQLRRKAELQAEAEAIRRRMRESQLTSFREESRNRIEVLRRLGHINSDGVVQLKGKAASEISAADELVVTELMFNGVFGSLDKHQLIALVSCFVPTEPSNEPIKLQQQLAGPLGQLQQAARETAEECKLEMDAEEYAQSFRASLMDVIYRWSQGASFAEITGMSDLFEGSIIRATRRLDELMAELERACQVVGDTELAAKFAESRATIRRDVMFAASLYV